MDDFVNVIRRGPQVQMKLKVIPDKYNKSPLIYQSKTG